jgi:hypothetical protein
MQIYFTFSVHLYSNLLQIGQGFLFKISEFIHLKLKKKKALQSFNGVVT